jgi:hypothetical protein
MRPMAETIVNAALRRLAFAGDERPTRGLRAIASTRPNESRLWQPDAIERALAHKDRDQVRAGCDRGPHPDERVATAQWWSDHRYDRRGDQGWPDVGFVPQAPMSPVVSTGGLWDTPM